MRPRKPNVSLLLTHLLRRGEFEVADALSALSPETVKAFNQIEHRALGGARSGFLLACWESALRRSKARGVSIDAAVRAVLADTKRCQNLCSPL